MTNKINRAKTYLYFLAVVYLVLGQIFATAKVEAQTSFDNIIAKETLNLDRSLIDTEGDFTQPRSILVAPIFLDDDVQVDPAEWYRGLFYYFSSDRHNYQDIPIHYVADQQGEIYQGIEGGVERQIVVENSSNAPIVIAYLAERGQTDFSLSSKSALRDFLIQLANENAIPADNIDVASLVLRIDREQQQATLTQEEIFGSWVLSQGDFRETVDANYNPIEKQYQIELVNYDNPSNSVQVGAELVLDFTIRNTGRYTIFADSDSELLLTRENGDSSNFFLNGQWVSTTQTSLMSSGDVLLPGDEGVFEARMNVPLLPGNYSEEFIIQTAAGQRLTNQDIEISVNISRGDLRLLEILDTETGTLNVRSNPGVGGELVGRVSPGERYEWTEQSNGWYKINLDDGEGWVSGRYAREI